MSKPNSRAYPRDPNLACLINVFFFFTLNPPRRAPQASSRHAQPKIRNTNYKHTNLKFIIFRSKITNTNTNPNTNTNINIEITNTNFKFMVFPFKITNTNTNPNTNINIEIINTNTNSHD